MYVVYFDQEMFRQAYLCVIILSVDPYNNMYNCVLQNSVQCTVKEVYYYDIINSNIFSWSWAVVQMISWFDVVTDDDDDDVVIGLT